MAASTTNPVPANIAVGTSAAPAKLYSLLLRLRPLEYGTLMPFSGELVHAAWLDWIRNATPDVSTSLHDGNQRRMFTCSSLQFPLSSQRMRQAERENVHLPVESVKTYTVRLTFLLGELFPLFYDSLMRFNMPGGGGAKKPPFMQIGKRLFLLEEVIADKDDSSGWAGFTTFAGLVEQVRATTLAVEQPLKLEFAAITTFSRNSSKERGISNHFAILPMPQYVFPGLVKRWQELAPPEMAHLVQRERIEAYIQEEGIIIGDYDLRPHWVTFVKHRQRGFAGTCSYILRGRDEPTSLESPLTVRQQMLLLAHLAFYTGVGAKTAMGMGQTRIVDLKV
jgi:CRISPR-associated endoribonuclease Cas6